MNKRMVKDILLVVVLTVFAAQLRVHPFDTTFRIGLGVIIFAMGILYKKEIPVLWTGVFVSIAILGFRTWITLRGPGNVLLAEALFDHIPGSLYYTFFAVLLKYSNVLSLENRPIHMGFALGAIDFTSNIFEIALRFNIVQELIQGSSFFIHLLSLLIVGMLRMFFVTGLYSTTQNQRLRLVRQAEKKKLEELVLLTSSLQAEVFYLQKSAQDMERLTKESYEIYKYLMKKNEGELGKKALQISRMMHEVKHDYTRINAGLKKLLKAPERTEYTFSEILDLSIKVHETYSRDTDKHVHFTKHLGLDFYPKDPLAWTSVLNNILANGVEAISKRGNIHVELIKQNKDLILKVSDTGRGISSKDIRHIFVPGFSNKLDEVSGCYSNGLGLSHVENLVEFFKGSISVTSEKESGTTFMIKVEENNVIRGDYSEL